MMAYDGGWVFAAPAGPLIARQASSAGGEVRMGHQTADAPPPIVFAALPVAAAPLHMTSDTRTLRDTGQPPDTLCDETGQV
jgi:hypothetical protein